MKRLLLVVLILGGVIWIGFNAYTDEFRAQPWQVNTNAGYVGSFAQNADLMPLGALNMSGFSGPEDITANENGELFVTSVQGHILKLHSETRQFESWAFTGGYPLGLRFDAMQNLIVADASRGLLSISPDKEITILVNQFEGERMGFVDALTIDDTGKIYFSDASWKYSPRDFGGPGPASEIDILEHGGNGRIFVFDPDKNETRLLVDNLQFANGVALSPDQQSLLIVETAKYRVLKLALSGNNEGELITLTDNLPGFPDNIVAHPQYGYWLGLTAPRSSELDAMSDLPLLRELVHVLPKWMQPSAQHYGHVVHIDETGQVVESLQDPSGSFPMTTGAMQLDNRLYVTSLTADFVGVRRLSD